MQQHTNSKGLADYRRAFRFLPIQDPFLPVRYVKKSVYLALMESTKKWTMPIHNWLLILNQFIAIFEQRVKV